MARLAIINTHPIQYYSPYYRALADQQGLDIHVFYPWRGALEDEYDRGFEKEVAWDVPLLEGYSHTFLENEAADPGTHHFRGITAPSLIPAVEDWGPDAVLVFGWNFAAHLRAMRYFHGRVPVFFRGDSTLLDESPGPRKWMRRVFLRWVYRHVDMALYVGRNNREYFTAHGLDDEQLRWVPHAVDNERFSDADSAEEEAGRWRNELGIESEDPVVLFAGKLEAKKAPDVLLDAFMSIRDKKAHLVFCGSGPLENELKRNVSNDGCVHFLGFQNQSKMPIVYRLGDVVVLPSRGPGETWGLCVNEAMACGRPVVVSSRVGCAPDLVDEKNGRVIPPEDPEALRGVLAPLLQDPSVFRRMGRHSAERIKAWSIDEAADRTRYAVAKVV